MSFWGSGNMAGLGADGRQQHWSEAPQSSPVDTRTTESMAWLADADASTRSDNDRNQSLNSSIDAKVA